MATLKEIAIIRAARAGQALAQLILGKCYLSGSVGLPKNLASALYWLDRAAQQNEQEAWLLIGSDIPFEIAIQAPQPLRLCGWYQRSFDAGVMQAGLVLAKLLLADSNDPIDDALRRQAMTTLETVARAGIVEAQWLLAKQLEDAGALAMQPNDALAGPAPTTNMPDAGKEATLEWAKLAAHGGLLDAQRMLADHSWSMGDNVTFLRWALPIARGLVNRSAKSARAGSLNEEDVILLARTAEVLSHIVDSDVTEIERFWEVAAQAGDKDAQLRLGLHFAHLDAEVHRVATAHGNSSYKKAIRWLTLAGEQGVAKAWYALSEIHARPSTGVLRHNLSDVQRYLELAAGAGDCTAQWILGAAAWRKRRRDEANDVRAAYWLRKAAAQDHAEAQALLTQVATSAAQAPWAQAAQRQLTADLVNTYPFLAARIEMAALFGLSLPEALLLDINRADRGHCLVVDIRAHYKRSMRRLILIQTGQERLMLNRIKPLFKNLDCGPDGPEGNYRQRLFRFTTTFLLSGPEREEMLKGRIKQLRLK